MSEVSCLTWRGHRTDSLLHQHQRTCVFEPCQCVLWGRSSSCLCSCSSGCRCAKAVRAYCPAPYFCRHLRRRDLDLGLGFPLALGPGRCLEFEGRLLQLKETMFVSETNPTRVHCLAEAWARAWWQGQNLPLPRRSSCTPNIFGAY